MGVTGTVHAQGLPQPSLEQGSAPGAARLFPALWAGHRAQEPHVSAPWIWALSGAGYSSCCLPSFSPPARPSSLFSRQALLTIPLHPVSRIPYSSAAPWATSNAVAMSISTLNEFSLSSPLSLHALPTSFIPLSAMEAHSEVCFSMCWKQIFHGWERVPAAVSHFFWKALTSVTWMI